MKELIKPNDIEDSYEAIETLNEDCTRYCRGTGPEHCNRFCSGGATNVNPVDEMDILF